MSDFEDNNKTGLTQIVPKLAKVLIPCASVVVVASISHGYTLRNDSAVIKTTYGEERKSAYTGNLSQPFNEFEVFTSPICNQDDPPRFKGEGSGVKDVRSSIIYEGREDYAGTQYINNGKGAIAFYGADETFYDFFLETPNGIAVYYDLPLARILSNLGLKSYYPFRSFIDYEDENCTKARGLIIDYVGGINIKDRKLLGLYYSLRTKTLVPIIQDEVKHTES